MFWPMIFVQRECGQFLDPDFPFLSPLTTDRDADTTMEFEATNLDNEMEASC